tara:strand:- start:32026 stop:32358 length:333 start_codon:yes stop_codon:yes gene_type:complete
MLEDLPIWVIIRGIIVLVFVIRIVVIRVFTAAMHQLLTASEAITIQTGVAVISVLVVGFGIIDSGTIMWTAVQAGPVLAADVAEVVAAFAPVRVSISVQKPRCANRTYVM